jgi:hypothetical protein
MIRQRDLFEPPERPDAGEIDPHVDATVSLDCRGRQSLHLVFATHISRYDQCLSASLFAFVRKILEQLRPPRRQHDARTLIRKLERNAFTEAAGSASDDDDLVRICLRDCRRAARNCECRNQYR